MFDHFKHGNLDSHLLITVLVALVLVDLLPTFLALALRRKDWKRIFAFNLVAGFSWPVWIAVLTWAIAGERKGDLPMSKSGLPAWVWPGAIALLFAGVMIYQHLVEQSR